MKTWRAAFTPMDQRGSAALRCPVHWRFSASRRSSTPCRVRSGAAWLRTTRAATTPTELERKQGVRTDRREPLTAPLFAAGLSPSLLPPRRHPRTCTPHLRRIRAALSLDELDVGNAAAAGIEPAASPASTGRTSVCAWLRKWVRVSTGMSSPSTDPLGATQHQRLARLTTGLPQPPHWCGQLLVPRVGLEPTCAASKAQPGCRQPTSE